MWLVFYLALFMTDVAIGCIFLAEVLSQQVPVYFLLLFAVSGYWAAKDAEKLAIEIADISNPEKFDED
jgi:hypothetical protein